MSPPSGVCVATCHSAALAKYPSPPTKADQGDFSRLPDKAAAFGDWFAPSPPPGYCWDRIHPQCDPTPPKSAAVRLHQCKRIRTLGQSVRGSDFLVLSRFRIMIAAMVGRQGGQAQSLPARLYEFGDFPYGFVRMALTSVILSPRVNVTALVSWVRR